MGKAVRPDIADWFELNVFEPLHDRKDPAAGIRQMFEASVDFFPSGRRIRLIGTLALDDTRDRFASEIRSYSAAWIKALRRSGCDTRTARATAEDVVAGIQGALVLARSLDNPVVFRRAVERLQRRVDQVCHD